MSKLSSGRSAHTAASLGLGSAVRAPQRAAGLQATGCKRAALTWGVGAPPATHLDLTAMPICTCFSLDLESVGGKRCVAGQGGGGGGGEPFKQPPGAGGRQGTRHAFTRSALPHFGRKRDLSLQRMSQAGVRGWR